MHPSGGGERDPVSLRCYAVAAVESGHELGDQFGANLEGTFYHWADTIFFDTNLAPAVAPRLQTNSQFLAGTRFKEYASRNSFGSGIWSDTESVAPFIETLTTMQWREPASVRTQAS